MKDAETPQQGKHPFRVPHHIGDDCWYSCPKSEEGCCNDELPKDVCTCGADKINDILASLERENAELKERLSTMYDGFSKSVLAVKDQQETIKRYKDALEAVQRITKDDRPILAQIISSALEGTNE